MDGWILGYEAFLLISSKICMISHILTDIYETKCTERLEIIILYSVYGDI